jgi:mono/diheme cytochrome c family protein
MTMQFKAVSFVRRASRVPRFGEFHVVGHWALILSLVLGAGTVPVHSDPPAPEAVDAAIDQLVALDPAVVKARMDEYQKQSDALAAEAAALKQQADALDQKVTGIGVQLEQLKAVAAALNTAFGGGEMAMAKTDAPAPTVEPAMEMKSEEAAAPAVNYQDHILPIFKERCAKCHNLDTRRSGLAVDTYANLMEGGSSGAVIAAGQPGDSRLFRLISGQEEPKMPPSGDALTAEQLALIEQWIQIGAPVDAKAKVAMKTAEEPAKETAVFVAAQIVDGPPPMPEATLPAPAPELAKSVVARAVAASPRAPLAAVAGYRQVLLYDLSSYTLLGALPFPEGEIYAMTFSVSGEVLVAGGGIDGDSGRVAVWNVRSGERVGTYGEEYDSIMAVDISPDHRMLALGGPSKTVKVYSVEDGSLLYRLTDHTDWIYAVKFTPDGELLASADRSGGLLLWQAANGRAVEALRGHAGAINDLSYSADSVLLASASNDGTVRLWDTWEYKQVRSFNAHGGGVLSVDFSAANELVTTGVDKLTKRWDSAGKELAKYEPLQDWGYAARFGAQGSLILAGSWTGRVAVWDVASGSQVAEVYTAPVAGDAPAKVAAVATPADSPGA